MKTLCYIAGKSGGHIIPCLTLAQQAKQHSSDTHTIFIGGTTSLDTQLTSDKQAIDEVYALLLDPFPRKKFWLLPRFAVQFFKSFIRALRIFQYHTPDKIITTGGLVSVPVCVAAYFLSIPIEAYELNATPGRAIRLIAPLATTIYVCFLEAQPFFSSSKCRLTNYPLRSLSLDINKEMAQKDLHLTPMLTTFFILGGSQGSTFLNTLWKEWLLRNASKKKEFQVIHHVGAHDKEDWQRWYAALGIPHYIFNFTHDISRCYRASDIVVCRSGAGTLFELKAFKVASITIPLPARVNNHQQHNANAMVRQSPSLLVITQELLEKDPFLFDQAIDKTLYAGQSSGRASSE